MPGPPRPERVGEVSLRRIVLARGVALLSLSVLIASGSVARAIPRYSALYGQDCSLCHHDPTGGGLRSAYATQYLIPRELAHRRVDMEALDRIQPLLGEHLAIGADVRTLVEDREGEGSTLFTMQTDLHLVIQMDETTSVSVDTGAGRRSEAWGLWRGLPAQGWLKAGRLVPAYGWRFADHQNYVRRHALSTAGEESPAVWEDSAIEVGVAPGPWQATASVGGGGGEVGETWTLRLVGRRSLGAWNLALGGSALRRQRVSDHRRAWGGFAYVQYRRLGWIGQWDEPREDDGRRERVITQQISWILTRGYTLLLAHDFHDPDRDRQSGTRQRYALGLDVLATPFVGVTAWLRLEDFDSGPDVVEADRTRLDLVLHFLF